MTGIERIRAELKNVKSDRYYNVLKNPVAEALISFCEQQPEFDQAVSEAKGSFSDCLAHVCKGIGGAISDIDAYRKAVGFYFPGAVVEMKMVIRMSEFEAEDLPPANEPKPEEKKPAVELSFDLMDLL